MNSAMNWVSVGAILVVIGCLIWTSRNKKKHPEKYKNESGNAVNVLFGDLINRESLGKRQKKGHIQSFAESREEAKRLRYNERQRQLHEDKPNGGMDIWQSKINEDEEDD